jgi:hypothetical protein
VIKAVGVIILATVFLTHATGVLVEATTSDHGINVHAINFTSQAVSSCRVLGGPLGEHEDHDRVRCHFFVRHISHTRTSCDEPFGWPEVADF